MSVAVVGSVNMDVVARVPRIPAPGETLLASGFSRGGGGKGANQAVGAARAGGAQTAFIGAVGDDADGAQLREWLEADGIDVSGLAVSTEPSGMALISVDDSAENTIVVVAGANHALTALNDRQRELVAGADTIAAQLEIPIELVESAADARGEGAQFVLNAAPSELMTDPDVAARVLPKVDVLVVNEHELLDVAGVSDQDEAIDLLAARVPALVVTLGAAGSVIALGDERAEVPAFSVAPVDTTGAGDTFCGVFAAHLHRGELRLTDLAIAARAGAAASAIAVTRAGAQPAVPTSDEVAQLLGA